MTTTPPSPRQLEMLQHALGLDGYGMPPEGYRGCWDDRFPRCYRNRYVTDHESLDGLECEAMCRAGWMSRPVQQPGFIGTMTAYSVTESGYKAVRDYSPKPPKLSQAKQRWRDYLATDGAFPDFKAYVRYITNKT